MTKRIIYFLLLSITLSISSCKKEDLTAIDTNPYSQTGNPHQLRSLSIGFPENFEAGTKTAYATGDVSLTSGLWNLNDALLGTSTSDRKNGAKSVRIQNTGMLTMNFNCTNGVALVSVAHAKYGTDANSTWSLYYSTNSGSTWTQTGSVITTSATTLTTASFAMSVTGNVRFQLRKLSGGRLNVDDFSVSDNVSSGPTRDNNLALGNPSSAVTSTGSPNNYLLQHTQYSLSYNNSRGINNWVSWHLSTAWEGAALRCNCFNTDASLPSTFFRATTSQYTNTGFDRGHMCPSEDRTASDTDNANTFLMANIVPQAPINNQQTWEQLEAYTRGLVNQGNEVYIIAGNYGTGGTGSKGGVTNTIAGGKITVPAHVWKVIVILPLGTDDANRVSNATRVIAIDLPNNQTVNAQPWGYYRTSVDAIEAATGYNILSNVAVATQTVVEAAVDSGPTQ